MRSPAVSQFQSAPHVVRVAEAGILTLGAEDLVLDDEAPTVGRAVAIRSGGRLAFRRVLEVDGRNLLLRCDVAPFPDRWNGDIVGCVRPRIIDRIAAIDPKRWTAGNWYASLATAHLRAAKKKLSSKPYVHFTTEVLTEGHWDGVRDFWRRACGRELPVAWQSHQQVIGLFEKGELVGVNIQLAVDQASFSAFTLVDRRVRGLGGGQRMIAHAVRLAAERGCTSMYVHISARNLPSIAAYRKAGFVKKGWWSDEGDPLAAAERQWVVFERDLTL